MRGWRAAEPVENRLQDEILPHIGEKYFLFFTLL